MTFHVQPNKMNLDKFLSLLKWCQENGLIDSFSEIQYESDEETEAYLISMVKESKEEYAKGNFMTNEEAEAKLDKWLKNRK